MGKCDREGDECPGGKCKTGVRNRFPDLRACADICELPGDDVGLKCGKKCTSICGRGFFLYGGTNCVKRCRKGADCGPRGGCATDDGKNYFCGGLCPSESCPYWYD